MWWMSSSIGCILAPGAVVRVLSPTVSVTDAEALLALAPDVDAIVGVAVRRPPFLDDRRLRDC